MNFAGFALLDWVQGYLETLFACQKGLFWLSSLYLDNKTFVFCLFMPLNDKIVIWQVANS
ncbi:hypothetical protein DPM18_00660 [Polynucleobacter paneuropaeus]|nr:hypothetical protein DPM18_00660 [Polynucleobacter paneuropaeus]